MSYIFTYNDMYLLFFLIAVIYNYNIIMIFNIIMIYLEFYPAVFVSAVYEPAVISPGWKVISVEPTTPPSS